MSEDARHENDRAIIEAIRAGGDRRLRAIEEVYMDLENRKRIFRYLQSKGAGREDVEDIYHEAIIAFQAKVASEKDFAIDSSIPNFIFGICRKKWWNAVQKNNRREQSAGKRGNPEPIRRDPYDHLLTGEQKAELQKVMAEMSESCREILTLWMYDYGMEEIARIKGYSNQHMARKAKYRCLQRLKELIEENPYFEQLQRS